MPKTKIETEKRPHAIIEDCFRLTDTQGLCLWGHLTEYTLAEVLESAYFNLIGGFMRHDRILLTAQASSEKPVYATLVVTGVAPGQGPTVELLESNV